MSLRLKHDHSMWRRIEAAYEIWEQMGDIDTTPSDEEVEAIREEMKARGVLDIWHDSVESVRSWFENRRAYSPYIDEVAVERALAFDEKVWANLTDRERSLVISLLDEGKMPTSHMEPVDLTPRHRRDGWERLSEAARKRIRDTVNKRRADRLRAVGAA